jgi:hypothetical protein
VGVWTELVLGGPGGVGGVPSWCSVVPGGD